MEKFHFIDRSDVIIFLFFVISVVIPIFLKKKNQRSPVSKKDITKNNQFVLENQERFEKIIDNDYNELSSLRTNIYISLIIFVIFIVSLFFIDNKIYSYVFIGISFILVIVCIYKYHSKDRKKYAEIVQKIIHEYNPELVYNPIDGFTSNEYRMCRFPETYDRFTSEDMITNLQKDFYFADIKVESRHEGDNYTYYITEYEGSLAKIKIKDIGCQIYLGGIRGTSIFQKSGYQYIKFENDEFNSLFAAYTSNELMAYKILTPDVMEEFVNIKRKMFGDVDIRIINDTLYIRFLSGNGFVNSSFNGKREKNSLFQSIAVLEEVIKIMNKVKTIIENKTDI